MSFLQVGDYGVKSTSNEKKIKLLQKLARNEACIMSIIGIFGTIEEEKKASALAMVFLKYGVYDDVVEGLNAKNILDINTQKQADLSLEQRLEVVSKFFDKAFNGVITFFMGACQTN